MKKAIEATKKEYQSSSGRTPEYLAWHRLFKRELTRLLMDRYYIPKEDIAIGKPNHFDLYGHFRYKGQWMYVAVLDIRWCKEDMLIRTATSPKDYRGGINQSVPLNNEESFVKKLDRILGRIKLRIDRQYAEEHKRIMERGHIHIPVKQELEPQELNIEVKIDASDEEVQCQPEK